MAFDVTLGQYYGTGSVIHRLDPRSKLLFVIFFIVSYFIYMVSVVRYRYGCLLNFLRYKR